MLDELLRHDSLGNKSEIEFVLFEALDCEIEQDLNNISSFCISNIFSISRSINGIICLLEFLSIIVIDDNMISVNQDSFNHDFYNTSSEYFKDTHFYMQLFKKLHLSEEDRMFSEDNIGFDHSFNQYYVKSHLIKLKLFPIRNLLLALGFLEADERIPNHLLVNSTFTKFFKINIISGLQTEAEISRLKRKITLKELERSLEHKSEFGRLGEEFVLKYEQNRLKEHQDFKKIISISDDYVNAGYDIESFDTLDSFLIDRFIEVKSYNEKLVFYWSDNEIQQAKELKNKYFLYLVDRSLMNQKEYIPKVFKNPYDRIFKNNLWEKDVVNWKISLKE